MNGASPVLVISVMLMVFCVLALVPVIMAVRSSDEAKRLMEVTRSPLRLEAKGRAGQSGFAGAAGRGALCAYAPGAGAG